MALDTVTAELFAKARKFVPFDLDARARYLERIQMAAVEDARTELHCRLPRNFALPRQAARVKDLSATRCA